MEDISILSMAKYNQGAASWGPGLITANVIGYNQRDITSFWAGYLSASILDGEV